MKKIILMTLVLLVGVGTATADRIGVYSEPLGFTCDLGSLVAPPGNNAVYIIHKFNQGGASASQFKVNDTSTLFPTSQTTTFLTIGTWNTDLSVAYGGCLVGDIAIMTLNFLWFGTPITGCANWIAIGPAPTSPLPGVVAMVECDFETITPVDGGKMIVNSTGNADECPESDCANAAEESTWGGVKALYR